MEWIVVGAFIVGFVVGIVAALILGRMQRSNENEVINRVEKSFAQLSLATMRQSTDVLLTMADQRMSAQTRANSQELDSKKHLIDQQLESMTEELGRVAELVKALEMDRVEKFGALANELTTVSQQIGTLSETTTALQRALADNRSRGQWGERMAEDILRLAGFVEDVSYAKQMTTPGERSRPDFTFFLPKGLVLNMDVKFPFDNYLRFLEAEAEADKVRFRRQFLRDVRDRIGEVVTRGYINPEQNTVNCVLLFIPNEQIYRFIHESDGSIIEAGLEQNVVICSPLTLFVVLAVIRQAAENFAIEQSSRDILALLGQFNHRWEDFVGEMSKLDRQISRMRDTYDELVTKRRRLLEKPLQEIEQRRIERGISAISRQDATSAD